MGTRRVLVSTVAASVLCLAVAPPAVAATTPQPNVTPAVFFAFVTTAIDIARAPGVTSPGLDIDELVYIVLQDSSGNSDEDLNAFMAEVEAQTRAKDSLRRLIADVERLEAALAAELGGCTTKPC